ncbi:MULTISPECIES: helix-turn-helix transcriptional regulator [Lactococcus]|uniref:helix-turn-helix transcriptional regulator n=1 Tax=Lactococcus TaxID=1357 RepID=UPI00203B57E6|nr:MULTISPECIES: helix-turn-helix domain-containing protein [Lactococcus]
MTYKPDDYLTTRDIADKFGISAPTVYRRKKEMAMLPKFRSGIFMGGSRIRFKELEEFMQYVHTPEYRQELKKLKAVIR